MRQKTFIPFFILFVQFATAQVPGYYIKNNGDTVHGTIKPKIFPMSDTIYWLKMQKEIHFIDESGNKIDLKPSADIKEVGFSGRTQYKMITFQGKDFGKKGEGAPDFDSDEYKFVRILWDGKIRCYDYYAKDMLRGQMFDVFYYNKVKDNSWAQYSVFKRKEVARKLFADCKDALNYFEQHDGLRQYHDCFKYYNENCK
jgi:hypothetical protein